MAPSRAWNSRSRRRTSTKEPEARLPRWGREAVGIALLGCSVFVFLSLYSYRPDSDPGFFRTLSPMPREIQNWGGPAGAYVASLFKEALGIASYLVVVLVTWAAVQVIRGRVPVITPWKIPLGLLTLIWTATLFSLAWTDRPSSAQGGFLGRQVARWMLEAFHPAGSYLLLVTLLTLSVAALGEIPFFTTLRALVSLSVRMGRGSLMLISAGARRAWWAARVLITGILAHFLRLCRLLAARATDAYQRVEKLRKRDRTIPKAEPEPVIVNHRADLGVKAEKAKELSQDSAPRIVPLDKDEGAGAAAEPSPSDRRPKARAVQTSLPFPEPLPEGYRLPPLDLLDDPDPTQSRVDEEALKASASTLEKKLRDFGIQGRVSEIHPGPIITLFEFEPASGIKVNRIVALADDLALAMKAMSVRIVAPIPGKSVVGIEVPNPKRQKVTLKEILMDKAFQSSRWKLPLALGKDIAGKPVSADLSRMPHLLIAGATGTGKSVNLHSMILSLLFRFTPQEVKFLMIDPKMLELTAYHGIPHLLHPVITDSRRASDVLDWAVERMEQRYQLLSEMGVRNIDGYNEKIDKGLPSTEELGHEAFPEFEGSEEIEGESAPEKGRLPYIVVVIDEMADLMIISGRQIEEAITRLAQMARAAGIHLLLATQRPSVDVLTGIIKANLPARISFQVSSRTDSRTILDCIGAEKLLGQGDMLFLPPGTSKVRRIHGPYVSEPEIERVVEYIKQFGKPRYEKIPFRSRKAKDEEEVFEQDEKYDEAVRLVAETRQASISMIQRKLRVGYNRAARMIERMEQEGLVGPQEGVKPREVFINSLE